MRGATIGVSLRVKRCNVSIHAPHARGDEFIAAMHVYAIVSIHAPHARGDKITKTDAISGMFQSTPLMRGATAIYCTAINSNHNIFLPST